MIKFRITSNEISLYYRTNTTINIVIAFDLRSTEILLGLEGAHFPSTGERVSLSPAKLKVIPLQGQSMYVRDNR